MKIKSINPSNEKIIFSIEEYSFKKCESILNKLKKEDDWKKSKIEDRLKKIIKLRDLLKKNKEKYSTLISLEMGKTITQSKDEIEKCIDLCNYYLKNAKEFLKDEKIKTSYYKSYITYEPLGVILGIMPWNYPFWQSLRSIIPIILSGNSYLLKPSRKVPLCALEIKKLFSNAKIKNFDILLTTPKNISKIISLVDAVTFTGGTSSGREIAKICAENLKKCILELGGSDPFLVLDNKNMKEYASFAVNSRLKGNGQSCTAAKRFIVIEKYKKEFENKLLEEFSKLVIGDPLKKETDIGPLIDKKAIEKINSQVKKSIKKGAKVLFLEKKLPKKGFYQSPVILTNVTSKMEVFQKETFGPVVAISKAKDEKEAIKLANNSSYGLGASIFSNDLKKCEEISKKLEAGIVFSNKSLSSDISFPQGGIKNSGYGKELSYFGIKEFTNAKTIIINKI